jgi:hypothetical protein
LCHIPEIASAAKVVAASIPFTAIVKRMFMKNDMNDAAPTTGKPLDAADAPGKADSEMFEADEIIPASSE